MKLTTLDLDGPVHYADFGGSGPPLLLIHGLGGSLVNWLAVAPGLAERFRVYALDLPGFGRSPLAGRGAGVRDQVEIVGRFLDRVAGAPTVLVGNSMGGLIAALTASVRPVSVARVVLVNAAFPPAADAPVDPRVAQIFALYLIPFAGELFLRRRQAELGPEGVARETLRLCGLDLDALPPAYLEAHLELSRARAEMPWAHAAFLGAARSLLLINMRRGHVHAALRAITAPTLLMQGSRDRLVSPSTAEEIARLRPDWTFMRLEGLGHVPQLEAPARWLSLVGGWLG